MLTTAGKEARPDQVDPNRYRPVGALSEPKEMVIGDCRWWAWRREEPEDSEWPPTWVLNKHQFDCLPSVALRIDGLALYESREAALAAARWVGVLVPAW